MLQLGIDSYKVIRFSESETYFDGIGNIHCCEINIEDKEHQYSMKK